MGNLFTLCRSNQEVVVGVPIIIPINEGLSPSNLTPMQKTMWSDLSDPIDKNRSTFKLIGVYKYTSTDDIPFKHPSELTESNEIMNDDFLLTITFLDVDINIILYFVCKITNLTQSFKNFLNSPDSIKNELFKLGPHIIDGNLMIKMSIKDTRVRTGMKLKQTYMLTNHQGDEFGDVNLLHITIDTKTSSVARNVIGLTKGYLSILRLELKFYIDKEVDGHDNEYIGGCEFRYIEL